MDGDREGAFKLTRGYNKDKAGPEEICLIDSVYRSGSAGLGLTRGPQCVRQTINTTVRLETFYHLARHGVSPEASFYISGSAMVSQANLSTLGESPFISRLPFSYGACD